MLKKVLKIIALVIATILIIVIAILFYIKNQIDQKNLVFWNGKLYKQTTLDKMYPQYIDVPAKNTPEEVYTKFREAILKGDVEEALKYIRKESLDEQRRSFEKKDILIFLKDNLPADSDLKKESLSGNFAHYYYQGKNKKNYSVDFVKNFSGYWEINYI